MPPEPAPPPSPAPPPLARRPLPAWPWLAMAAGVALIGAAALLEDHTLSGEPYTKAVLFPEYTPAGEPGLRTMLRRIPLEQYPPDPFADAVRAAGLPGDVARAMQLDRGEAVVALDVAAAWFAPLLASGRLPAPEAGEVLAGDLTRLDAFEIDGEPYTVVGRIRSSFGPALGAYFLPAQPMTPTPFLAEYGAAAGSLHLDGLDRLEALMPEQDDGTDGTNGTNGTHGAAESAPTGADGADTSPRSHTSHSPEAAGLRARTRPAVSWLTVLGLLVAATGGAGLCMAWCRMPPLAAHGYFAPLRREARYRPRLLMTMHALLYGLFFAGMAESLGSPLTHLRLSQLVMSLFSDGALGYIGQAYASGNIASAAATTFINNYLVQTLGLTFLAPVGLWSSGLLPTPLLVPILLPLPLGIVKTAFSFLLAGAVMAPGWTGLASGYTYHALTMLLELEAYILACFVVAAWPLRLIEGWQRNALPIHARQAILLFGDGILLTGLMLAAAAAYEAATLILLN